MCVFKCKLLRKIHFYYSVLLCVKLAEVPGITPGIKNPILKKDIV